MSQFIWLCKYVTLININLTSFTYRNSLESDSSMIFSPPKELKSKNKTELEGSLNSKFGSRGQAVPKTGKGDL